MPTLIAGGEWIVSYPASCSISYHVAYLPGQADEDGWGNAVERELEECVARPRGADSLVGEHPPRVAWATDVPRPKSPSTSRRPDDAGGERGRGPSQFAWRV